MNELEDPAEPNMPVPAMTGLLPSWSKGRAEDHILQPKGPEYSKRDNAGHRDRTE